MSDLLHQGSLNGQQYFRDGKDPRRCGKFHSQNPRQIVVRSADGKFHRLDRIDARPMTTEELAEHYGQTPETELDPQEILKRSIEVQVTWNAETAQQRREAARQIVQRVSACRTMNP